MSKRTSFVLIVFIFAAFLTGIVFMDEYFKNKEKSEKQEKIVVHKDYNFVLLSQQELIDLIHCEEFDLWIESEKAYESLNGVKLNATNIMMVFSKDPACTDPLGGESEWKHDKICYQYKYLAGSNQIKEAKALVEGKNIVLIGSVYLDDSPYRFVGKLYWY